jgi:hypothetical protein
MAGTFGRPAGWLRQNSLDILPANLTPGNACD